MAIAAISNANHYLVDVIAGMGISALAILAVQLLFRKLRFDTLHRSESLVQWSRSALHAVAPSIDIQPPPGR
jgi:membrane-associated phospholipid phosphatase